jgi:tetratricopeptide (TPR) repeat protein
MMLYWWKLLMPVGLNAYTVFSPIRSIWDLRAISGLLFVCFSCVALWLGIRRSWLAAFAALWVFLSLLPVMNIYALGRNVFAERYLYLPSVGFCLLTILLAEQALKRLPKKGARVLSPMLLTMVAAWFTAQTISRNRDWRDDATLFTRTLNTSGDAPFVHVMVASAESDDGEKAQAAEGHYQRAITLAERESPPDFLDMSRAYEGLSSLYSDDGQYDHALETLHRWRSAMPGGPEADCIEGIVLLRSGRPQEAETMLKRAYAAEPRNENALNALGLLAMDNKQNPKEALDFFEKALAVHTADDSFRASLYSNLGGSYGELHEFTQAIDAFRSAVAISPENPEYLVNLANALAAAGRYDEAATEATAALRFDPTYVPAQKLLEELSEQRSQR